MTEFNFMCDMAKMEMELVIYLYGIYGIYLIRDQHLLSIHFWDINPW